jgi:hypothetical protein
LLLIIFDMLTAERIVDVGHAAVPVRPPQTVEAGRL